MALRPCLWSSPLAPAWLRLLCSSGWSRLAGCRCVPPLSPGFELLPDPAGLLKELLDLVREPDHIGAGLSGQLRHVAVYYVGELVSFFLHTAPVGPLRLCGSGGLSTCPVVPGGTAAQFPPLSQTSSYV